MNKRSLVLVDAQQLFLSCREEYGITSRLDFLKLKDLFRELEGDDSVIDQIIYILSSPLHDDRNFIRFLKKHNYITVRKTAQLNKIGNGAEPGLKGRNWTESMLWEGLKMLPKYDSIIIVSGNGAFNQLINAAKLNHKRTTVISFKTSLQKGLASSADKTIILDNNFIYDSSAFNQGL